MLRDERMSAITREPISFNNCLGFETGFLIAGCELAAAHSRNERIRSGSLEKNVVSSECRVCLSRECRMTRLIKGSETLQAIKQALKAKSDTYAAVAYWNGGSSKHLIKMAGKNLHVVLDVNAGGTSERELKYLIKHLRKKVKVHPNLHTKIYASQDMAVVGSSNASKPGLHLEPTSRAEASILVTDEAAASAFLYAKELYDAAEVASQKHVEICRKRFMRNRLGEAEAMEGKVDLLTALWERRDLLDEIPLILTYEETRPTAVTKEFNRVRVDLADEGEDSNSLNQKQWTDFNWKLDEQYDGKLCITVHRKPQGSFWVALVRPVLTLSGTRTFAKYQPWSEISFLDYGGQRFRKIEGDRLEAFKKAFIKIQDRDGFVRVKNLSLKKS